MGYEGRGVDALRYALDRVAFARHVAPAVGIKEFDGWQLDLLRSRSKRILINACRIEARPGSEKTARGRSANLLVIDEAARVDDELYRALRPMLLATRGDLIMLSTPWGKTGVFYREWTREDSTWERHFVPATEVKRFTPEQLAEERKQGERYFKRELLCQFAEAEGQVFSEELINRAIRMDIEPLFPEFDILRQEDLEEEQDREEGDSDLISSLWEAFND